MANPFQNKCSGLNQNQNRLGAHLWRISYSGVVVKAVVSISLARVAVVVSVKFQCRLPTELNLISHLCIGLWWPFCRSRFLKENNKFLTGNWDVLNVFNKS